MSVSLRSHGLQQAKLACSSLSPGAHSNSCPLCQWCHSTISSSVTPLSYLQSFPTLGFFLHWVSSLHQVAKVLELQLQHQSFQWISRVNFLRTDWYDLLAAQGALKSVLHHHNSKAVFCSAQLSFCPILISLHDYCKNYSFDYTRAFERIGFGESYSCPG